MKKALFVTYGGGHVPMAVAVLRELARRGGWDATVLGLTTARAALERAGIPSLGFKDLVEPGDQEALRLGAELARENHREGVGISLEESTAYLGLSYADLRQRLGPEAAETRYRQWGRAAFLPLGPLERLFRRVSPDIVVTTSSPRSEEAAIRLSRTFRLPSVCMVDFFVPEMIRTDWITPFLVDPDYADRLTVFSGGVCDRFIALGRRPEDVVVTGNPAFDRLGDPGLTARAAAWRKERGLDGRKVILFASQPEPGNERLSETILRTLLEALPSRPDWHLIHRRHPSESFPDLPLPPRAGRSDSHEDLAVVLAASDVVLTCTSTVGIEAVLLDKPLVKICLSAWDRDVPYDTMGVALGARRLEEIAERVEEALSDSPGARALAAGRASLPRPGDAARRISELLETLATH